MARRMLVIGSANADLIMRVPRLPRPGESLPGCHFATATGGKGANQAIAAGRLGGRVAFAGRVGGDAFGMEQRRALEAAGVDCTHLRVDADRPTGTAVILVAEDGENAIAVAPGANGAITAGDVDALEGAIAEAEVLLLQLEIPIAATCRALALARKHATFSILDAGPAQPLDPAMLALADCVSPNETEAEAITGLRVQDRETARAAAHALLGHGTPRALMKLGAQGCLYVGPEGEEGCPAFRVRAVDTVAAGDAFTAAFALHYRHASLIEALRFACAAGALATTRPGATPSLPSRAEVEGLLAAQPA